MRNTIRAMFIAVVFIAGQLDAATPKTPPADVGSGRVAWGSKIVPGAWDTGRYAASMPKERSAAAHNMLAEIVNEAKRTGLVQRAIDQAGFKGVRVAQ